MGRTIIQPIGPLYGEAVNGTVYGRPNGSIYIPSSNRVDITSTIDPIYIRVYNSANYFCNDTGVRGSEVKVVAQSQDNAAYCRVDVSDDSDFTTYSSRSFNAGNFNFGISRCVNAGDNPLTIVNGQTYYVRVALVAASNVDVAMSAVMEVIGYDSE